MSNNTNIITVEVVEKLLDLLVQLEEQGNIIIKDIKESTQNPIIKERMKEKIKKLNELFDKINTNLNSNNLNCLDSGTSFERIIQYITHHEKILDGELNFKAKIHNLAHDLNEISKTNKKN
ncbi:hypothetical protein H8356DRAFT_1672226 [Neocallimastix lanati (nom. inval.)]|jgi:hypothetical protein|uniref:Uncharacterized protein n=1 Tax=Neocallimastix californiae TaxID=1754190 RepID=A0A1Y2FEG7_9FUNG|nr:hypothetical protein H8356DRAFT_1672226 [Neocallimastix sp. JGI-2020a]ORY82302.1 hypothetical protein LY90DRAFT_664155 [Neocallimastix californiae]|eukprot:ORY82302.1 hypothetical protein LY90DRAFT_664155 [Neocallimastix californiae]